MIYINDTQMFKKLEKIIEELQADIKNCDISSPAHGEASYALSVMELYRGWILADDPRTLVD